MSTAEFVSYLWSPGLSQEDLDEESIFSVGWDHDLLDVRVRWALITTGREWENSQHDFLYSSFCKRVYMQKLNRCIHSEVAQAEVTVGALTRWARLCTGAGLAGYCPPVVSGWQLAWTCSPTPACSPLSHLGHTHITSHKFITVLEWPACDESLTWKQSQSKAWIKFWMTSRTDAQIDGLFVISIPCFWIKTCFV